MTQTLLILPDRPDGDALFVRRQGSTFETIRGSLKDLQPQLDAPYALVLPGQQVRAFLTDIPETVRGPDRINIARFAHEDCLGSDLAALHILVGPGDPAQTLMVDKAVMDTVLTTFDSTHIFVDYDLLTGVSDKPVRLLDRVVTPGPEGDAVDRDWSDGSEIILDDMTLAQALFDRVGKALDLRSGPYRRRAQIQLGAWRSVAAGLLICIGLGVALSWANIRATHAQAETIRATAQQAYTEATGQAAPDNLARAIRTNAPTDADPTVFLKLSHHLFTAMAMHPDISVERLSFDPQENRLRLRLIYSGFEAAGALEQTVASGGATFQTGGVREQNGRFIGDASLSLGEVS